MNALNEDDQQGVPLLFPILAILVGYAAAVLLMPEIDYYQRGKLIPAGIAMSLGLLAGPIYAAVARPNTLFRLEYLLMFGLFYWVVLDAAQGAYGFVGVSRETLVSAFGAVALFAVAIWLGSFLASLRTVRLPRVASVAIDARLLFLAAMACFLLGMLRVFLACKLSPVCIASQLFLPRFESAWHTANIGNFDTLLMRLQYFGYLVLPLTAVLYHVERRITWRVVLLALLGLFFLLILVQGGGRRQVGMVLGITGIVWMLLNRPVKLRDFIVLGAIAAILLALMQFMHTWRYQGIGEAVSDDAGEVSYMLHERLIKVDKNLLFMSQIMERVPKLYPYTGMTGIEYIVTAPIPRAIYPDKPVQRGFPLARILHMRVQPSWTWTVSAVGDFYLIGGFAVIAAGGLFFGVLAGLGNRLLRGPPNIRNVMLYGVVAMTLFIGLRTVHEIIISGFAVLAVWGVLYALRMVQSRVGERRPSIP